MKKFILKFRTLGTSEKGSTIVIVALSFTMLVIAAALVIDLGSAYYETAELENAADAAVLAAGQLLPVNSSDMLKIRQVKQLTYEYAVKNGSSILSPEDIILDGLTNGYFTRLSVNISMAVNTSFARVIGIHSINVTRRSAVKIAPVYKVYGAVPFAIKKDVLDTCITTGLTTHIPLKFGGGSGVTGDYGVIDLDGVRSGGANDVDLWINYGYTAMLSSGDALYPVETGNMAGIIENAVERRYNSCTHFSNDGGCTAAHFAEDCPRILTVPVVVSVDKHDVKIVGFAAFILEPASDKGFVYGSIVRKTIAGVASNSIDVGGDGDYWLYSLVLAN